MFDRVWEKQKGKLTRQGVGNRTVHKCVHSPTFEFGFSVTPSDRSASTIAHVHRNRYPALQKLLHRKFGSPREQGDALVYGANGIEYYLGRDGSKTNVMYVITTA